MRNKSLNKLISELVLFLSILALSVMYLSKQDLETRRFDIKNSPLWDDIVIETNNVGLGSNFKSGDSLIKALSDNEISLRTGMFFSPIYSVIRYATFSYEKKNSGFNLGKSFGNELKYCDDSAADVGFEIKRESVERINFNVVYKPGKHNASKVVENCASELLLHSIKSLKTKVLSRY